MSQWNRRDSNPQPGGYYPCSPTGIRRGPPEGACQNPGDEALVRQFLSYGLVGPAGFEPATFRCGGRSCHGVEPVFTGSFGVFTCQSPTTRVGVSFPLSGAGFEPASHEGPCRCTRAGIRRVCFVAVWGRPTSCCRDTIGFVHVVTTAFGLPRPLSARPCAVVCDAWRSLHACDDKYHRRWF